MTEPKLTKNASSNNEEPHKNMGLYSSKGTRQRPRQPLASQPPPEPDWLAQEKTLIAQVNSGVYDPEFILQKMNCEVFVYQLDEDKRRELITRKIFPKEKILQFLRYRSYWTRYDISESLQYELLEAYLEDLTEQDIIGLCTDKTTDVFGSESEPCYSSYQGCPNVVKVYAFISEHRALSPDARFEIGFVNRIIKVSREGFSDEMNRLMDMVSR